MKQNDWKKIVEALKSAHTEIEAIEADSDYYVPSGRLMEQIEEAIDLAERALEKARG